MVIGTRLSDQYPHARVVNEEIAPAGVAKMSVCWSLICEFLETQTKNERKARTCNQNSNRYRVSNRQRGMNHERTLITMLLTNTCVSREEVDDSRYLQFVIAPLGILAGRSIRLPSSGKC